MSGAALLRPDAPSGPKAAATRESILETAERLFRTLGYQKTAVADIARELGMSPANVYRFFASKAAINEAIAARLLSGLAETAWVIARDPARTPPDRLRALFAEFQRLTLAHFFNEKKMHDMVGAAISENWPVIERFIDDVEGAIRHIVTEGQARGDFARLDPIATAHLVHSTMIHFTHPLVIDHCAGDEDLPALAAGMAEFVLRALRPHPDDRLP